MSSSNAAESPEPEPNDTKGCSTAAASGGRRVLTPVVVCGSPCMLPQKTKDSPMISPLLTAAAATAAGGRTTGTSLPQNNVPVSESEKLTALNHHVLRELKAPRPQPPDIESVVCPASVQQFRKAWWAGVRPTTCERTCRHRSKVCDAIQLCNDCTGYYCKWLADLVGIPVLKASGRVDPLVFHKDPLAKLYWERISKVVCCPKSTTKCLMCIRRYQLFTHFLPGNLLFRGLVHQSVMKLHEEGFSVDMGLIRKVTRRHLERIAEGMDLQLPPEYFSSLQAYDIIVRRGPLVEVLTNGLSSALAVSSGSLPTTSRSPALTNASPRNSGSSPVQQFAAGQPARAGDEKDVHTVLRRPSSPDTARAIKQGIRSLGDATNAAALELLSRLSEGTLSERFTSDPPADDTYEQKHGLLAASQQRSFADKDNDDLVAPMRCGEDSTLKMEDGDDELAQSSDSTVKNSGDDAPNTSGEQAEVQHEASSETRTLRSRRHLKRPIYNSLGSIYYSNLEGEEGELLSMLGDDESRPDGTNETFNTEDEDSESTYVGDRKKRRRTSRRADKNLTYSNDSGRLLHEGFSREELDKTAAAAREFVDMQLEELAHQFPDEPPSTDVRKSVRRAGHRVVKRHRLQKAQKSLRDIDAPVSHDKNAASAEVTQGDFHTHLLEQVAAAFFKRLASTSVKSPLATLPSTTSQQSHSLNTVFPAGLSDVSIDEASHSEQLAEEHRLAHGGIRGVFWEPAKEAWCVLLPLLPTGPLAALRRRILSFSVRQWGSFSSAKWSAVYERVKRNPEELKSVDQGLRQELSTWVKTNLETTDEAAFPVPLDSAGSTRESTTETASFIGYADESKQQDNPTTSPDVFCGNTPARLADLLGSLAKALGTQPPETPQPSINEKVQHLEEDTPDHAKPLNSGLLPSVAGLLATLRSGVTH